MFDVRLALVSAIGADTEYIIGQSGELPAALGGDAALPARPRGDAVCDHVVSSGQPLVIADTQRDPRFADRLLRIVDDSGVEPRRLTVEITETALLVDPDAYVGRGPRVGELVLVADPRRSDRLLVKRVADVASGGAVDVVGDAPWASTDSRAFGPVTREAIAGRPFFRYRPLRRLGRVG